MKNAILILVLILIILVLIPMMHKSEAYEGIPDSNRKKTLDAFCEEKTNTNGQVCVSYSALKSHAGQVSDAERILTDAKAHEDSLKAERKAVNMANYNSNNGCDPWWYNTFSSQGCARTNDDIVRNMNNWWSDKGNPRFRYPRTQSYMLGNITNMCENKGGDWYKFSEDCFDKIYEQRFQDDIQKCNTTLATKSAEVNTCNTALATKNAQYDALSATCATQSAQYSQLQTQQQQAQQAQQDAAAKAARCKTCFDRPEICGLFPVDVPNRKKCEMRMKSKCSSECD